ncbi:hypothetical protein MBANPS3_009136 [Mucor bainieri]
MITSQHVVFFIIFATLLHSILEPRHASMKGLLQFKQLFDERCQVSALTVGNTFGFSSLSYLNKLYRQFNHVNVTVCQAMDLSISGKPSEQWIAGMSHSYTGNTTTKYFAASPLVNELLIESILIKDNPLSFSASVSLDHLWIYLPLVFFIIYPFVHDNTVSCYRFIKSLIFNSAPIHKKVAPSEPNDNAPEAPTTTTASTRRSSNNSSIGSIHLDYTNYAAYNATADELLEEAIKANNPAEQEGEMPDEASRPQRSRLAPKPAISYSPSDASKSSKTAPTTGQQHAAKKQSINDSTDQRGAFFKLGNLGTPDTAAEIKKPASTTTAARPPASQYVVPVPQVEHYSPSAGIASSLTEAMANAPFMPRKKARPEAQLKTQSKAPTNVKLSFSRFQTKLDDSPPATSSNAAGPSSAPSNQPSSSYKPGLSTAPVASGSSDTQTSAQTASLVANQTANQQATLEPAFAFGGLVEDFFAPPSAPNQTQNPGRVPAAFLSNDVQNLGETSPVPCINNDGLLFAVTLSTDIPEPPVSSAAIVTSDVQNLGGVSPASGVNHDGFESVGMFAAGPAVPPVSAVAIFASDVQNPGGASPALKKNCDGFESLGIFAADTTDDPPADVATVSSNEQSLEEISLVPGSNEDGFESVGILVAGTTDPSTATAATADSKRPHNAPAVVNASVNVNATDTPASDSVKNECQESQTATNAANTAASPSASSNDQSSGSSASSSWLAEREARREARYAAKIEAMFPSETPIQQPKSLANGAYVPLGSGTPLFGSISQSAFLATAAAGPFTSSSQPYTGSSSGTGSSIDRSPLLLVDTDRPAGEQDTTTGREVSDLLICQPAVTVEVHPSEEMLQILKKKAKERAIQEASQQESINNKGKGKGKSKNKKKKGKRR